MEDFNQLFDDVLLNIDKVDDQTVKLKEGERRMVAVLFADIKGFTNLSETLDHEDAGLYECSGKGTVYIPRG